MAFMTPPPHKPWEGASLLPPPLPAVLEPRPVAPPAHPEEEAPGAAVRSALWAFSGYVEGSRILAERLESARHAG